MSGFVRFSSAMLLAVFLLYPAFMAASVAFPLMIYSSANLCCFNVNLIYHQLLSAYEKRQPHLTVLIEK